MQEINRGAKIIPVRCQERTHQRYKVKAGGSRGFGHFGGQVGPLWEGSIWLNQTDGRIWGKSVPAVGTKRK